MNILNKEELKKQIQEGKEISLDGILEEFKILNKDIKIYENIFNLEKKKIEFMKL